MTKMPNRRVLIVDDTPAIHDDFRKILGNSSQGSNSELDDVEAALFGGEVQQKNTITFELDSAYQGQEALTKVEEAIASNNPYALAFVDMRMPPGWDGVETIEHLWEVDPKLQIVICTAYSDYTWDEILQRLNVGDRLLILKKPFDAIELFQLANTLTVKWQMTQAAAFKMSSMEEVIAQRTQELQRANAALQEDILVKKRAAQEIARANSRLERVMIASADGVFECEVGKDDMFWSQRFFELIGFATTELPARKSILCERIHPEDKNAFESELSQSEMRGYGCMDFRILHKDGAYRWMRNRVKVFDANETQPRTMVGVWTDIADLKMVQQQLRNHRDHLASLVEERTAKLVIARDEAEKASQSKSEFLANMSHELRTPMHAILSFAQFGIERWQKSEPEKLCHWFENIQKSGQRLLNLLNDLLDLSKLEAGKMLLNVEWRSILSVLDELRLELDVLLEKKNIQLKIEVKNLNNNQPVNTHAWIDNARFMQVLRNVIANAIKFSPTQSEIKIVFDYTDMPFGKRAEDAKKAIRALQIQVIDQGPGIPEGELESIFDKFVQSSKTKTGAGGTGLGLAICREILLAHHATILAKNNPPEINGGQGACFEICLPLISQDEQVELFKSLKASPESEDTFNPTTTQELVDFARLND